MRVAIVFILMLFNTVLFAQNSSKKLMERSVKFLAADSMKGREPGTREDRLAADYIADILSSYGYKVRVKPFPLTISNIIDGDTVKTLVTTYNVEGELKSEDLTHTSIVIGAHYDHLGMGGRSSMQRGSNEVHNGADDNASGVASMIEIARLFSAQKRDLKHNIIITAFGAEEKGLVGSAFFADSLKKSDTKAILMFNLDMVGRLNNKREFQVGGVGTFKGAKELAEGVTSSLNITMTEDGYGPSDHSSFYVNEIPVLYFTTGAHKDYHRPTDDVDKINFKGMVEVTDYIFNIAKRVAFSSDTPRYVKMQRSSTPARSSFKVTLGIMPDVVYDKGDGLRVNFATDGKPAQAAGVKRGDIITEIGGNKVSNIEDYMKCLSLLKEGETVSVTINRDSSQIKLEIKL